MRARLLPALLVGALAVAGCGLTRSTKAKDGDNTIRIAITDDGCVPKPTSAPAGPLTFKISNENASRVSEAELMQSGRILGEKENLSPGLSGSFTLRLDPGEYTINCPNAKSDQATFTVAGKKGTDAVNPSLTTAATAYQTYVIRQIANLVRHNDQFVAAIRAGDIAKAKALYAPTRAYYETIEPVAESFGNLDPDIDARVNDVANPERWSGFHRIEKALWRDDSLAGMGPVAAKLAGDIGKLRRLTERLTFQPAQIANGAVSLLDEVAKSKLTGEEDPYSHTDLWDFAANVAGAREAFQVLRPALAKTDRALATTIDRRFRDVMRALAKYQMASGYVSYNSVGQADRRRLSSLVNALAEPLSQVAGKVA